MKPSLLKKLRVILALLFFAPITFLFIDLRGILDKQFYEWAVYLQFVPSILKSISVLGILHLGFIVILVLTLLLGRVYCSTICPLGILQDIISQIAKRVKKVRYKYRKTWTATRYSILGITVLAAVMGGITFLSLLDPYSLFGRTVSYLFKPVVIWLNNIGAEAFISAGVYSVLYRYDLQLIHWGIMAITLLSLTAVALMSFTRGRLYCNMICPVGTALGFLSKFSILKIELDKELCTRCGNCMRACKSECINLKHKKVDYSRCVLCFNCISACKEGGALYRMKQKRTSAELSTTDLKVDTTDLKKRSFIAFLILGIVSLCGGEKALAQHRKRGKGGKHNHSSANNQMLPENKNHPVSPPGSGGIERFNNICTACSLCVSACPTKVLKPAFSEYGLIGFMQPHMDFVSGLCSFDCTVCGDVCPTGAIKPLTMEQKHITQVGQAKFVKDNCIVETDGTDCGACSEHCPTKAVAMVPYGDLFIPEVTTETCVGCGACEHACPLDAGIKAIYVDGNYVHADAQKPKTEKAKIDLEDDEFPF